MKRLSPKELEKITKLIAEGKSLNQISKKLTRSKTTIYYHFRKIKGRMVKPITILSNDEEHIGEFMGLFAGDGCADVTKTYQYRTFLCFNVTEWKFAEDLITNVLLPLFGKRPMIFRQESRLTLRYYSKNIHKLIQNYLTLDKRFRKTYSVRLKAQNYSNKFIIGFIRGSLDSDGYFSEKKISFATVSPGLMKNISEFLDIFGFTHSVRLYKEKRSNRKDIYHIYLFKKKTIKDSLA